MLLSQTKEKGVYNISNINVINSELKRRLYSFGINKGKKIEVLAISLSKSNMEVEVGGTAIALRLEEAKQIEVEEVI